MIKFLALKAVNKRYEKEYQLAFKNFLNAGNYILGSEVNNFESEFKSFCGTDYCVGVNSGLAAIKLILEAFKVLGGLSEGDEVIVPANTYIASVLAISHAGLKPVLVEPTINTFNIDVTQIEKSITPRTRAILGVHLYGQLYDVEGLECIAKIHNLILIEDSAQAHGAVYRDGRKAGNLSHAAAFSFYPTKNLGALGDAGAITTNNAQLAKVLFKIRNYGRSSTYEYELKGYNCRLDELQAAFLRVKLKFLEADNNLKRTLAKSYFDGITNEEIILPLYKDIHQHVFHLFVIKCKRRNELKNYLYKNGVETLIHYPIPIHKQKAYGELFDINLPITEQIHDEILSLPLFTTIKKNDIYTIIGLINSFN